jgi:transposase
MVVYWQKRGGSDTMNRTLPQIKESLNTLQDLLHREKDVHRKVRLHMLTLLKSGESKTRQAVADRLAVHRNTIGLWLSLYASGGMYALLHIHSPGGSSGQRSLSQDVLNALQDRLSDPKGFGSYGEILSWLQSTYQVEILYPTLYRIVHYELGAKPKIGRPSHVKKTKIHS